MFKAPAPTQHSYRSLSGKHYMKSLIETGAFQGTLDDDVLKQIESEGYALLVKQLEAYSKGRFTSVPIDFGDQMLTSILYTIGFALKGYASPETAIEGLKTEALITIFERGQKKLKALRLSTRHLYQEVRDSALPLDNDFYRDTVFLGIPGFFKLYNLTFAAHRHSITADYPLAIPINTLTGLEFIHDYLAQLLIEQRSLTMWSEAQITDCLKVHGLKIQSDYFNAYEHIMLQALGVQLSGRSPLQLKISAFDLEKIHISLALSAAQNALDLKLDATISDLIKGLALVSPSQIDYLLRYSKTLKALIHRAFKADQLHRLFGV